VIAYVLLSAGVAGTATCAYFAAPAARGTHRYLVPRSVLRAENVRLDGENEELAHTVVRLTGEVTVARKELDETAEHLVAARTRILDLEEQLGPFDRLCADNTRLRAELANARAVRSLYPGPSPADDASALPDGVQEFVDDTATAWRATPSAP
jgi:hypothetical protein